MRTAHPTSQQTMKLMIEDSESYGDNSCVFLSKSVFNSLELQEGDIVHVFSILNRKEILAIVFLDSTTATPDNIRMNHVCRKNLAAQVGDSVQIKLSTSVVELARVVVRKIGGSFSQATPENHEQIELCKYFGGNDRPICRENYFEIKTDLSSMEFIITYTEPAQYGLVNSNTMIAIDWQNYQL